MQHALPTWFGPDSKILKDPGKALTAAIAIALLSFVMGVLFGQVYSGKAMQDKDPRSDSQDTVHGRFGRISR